MHKRMSVKDFRELGYLQELNRRFLHPLGLALEIVVDPDGNEHFGEVWDERNDPEGMMYGPDMIDADKALRIEREYLKKREVRQTTLGFDIQPLGREVKVRDLQQGDKVFITEYTTRTIRYCVPSSIDPVYLLGFEDSDVQIAKGPDDSVRII